MRDERGTVAVEMAFVLPVFLLLVYGGLAFGLAMSAKSTLNEAAAEGARAAISATTTASIGPVSCTTNNSAATDADGLACNQALKAVAGLGSNYKANAAITTDYESCGGTCYQETVTISYPYNTHPMIPNAPGLGLVLPSALNASYTVEVS